MNKNTLQLSLVLIIAMTVINPIKAQVFTGFSAFKKLIEYEGQRFLMQNIYQIKSEDFDKLKISKSITEIDQGEGFMFVLTSYTFNGKNGVVITSFNSISFSNTQHQFVNIHLTNSEFTDLCNTFNELEETNPQRDEHILRKFNDRLIVDVNNISGFVYFTLWVDNHSRHTFTKAKWNIALQRHNLFLEK